MVGVLQQCNGRLQQLGQTSEFAEVSVKVCRPGNSLKPWGDVGHWFCHSGEATFFPSFCTAWSTDAICKVMLLYSSRTVFQMEAHVMFAHRSLPRSEKNAFTIWSQVLCAHACLLSSLIKLRWTQSSLKSGECRSLKLGTKIWDLAQGTWHRNLEHGSMLQICNAIHCFDSSSLSQHKRCPAKRSLPRFKLSTTLPSLQPSPIHKNMPLASHKRTCIEFYSIWCPALSPMQL